MENLIEGIILVVIGWLLGLLAPIIVDVVRNKQEVKVVKKALFIELQELQYRFMLVAFRIDSKYGKIDKSFFEWAQKILIGYKGINSSEILLKTIGPLLKLTDEEMVTYSEVTKQQDKSNSGLELKKVPLSLLDSHLTLLTKFDPMLQTRLLEIKTRIGFINETVDDSRYYFRLSFSDISDVNYEIADQNMKSAYQTYSSQAKITADLIGKVLNT